MALRWNYTLGTGEFVASTSWQLDGSQIAFAAAISVISDNRFDFDKSEVATLIIKNVSEMEDATIQCAVQTSVGIWKYNIRLEITGERQSKLILLKRVCVVCFQMLVVRGRNIPLNFSKLTGN